MKYKDILVKVREREEEIDFLKRCKRVFVCPPQASMASCCYLGRHNHAHLIGLLGPNASVQINHAH